jgi:hypothetical protein
MPVRTRKTLRSTPSILLCLRVIRPRQVDIPEHLLAPVSLQIQQHRGPDPRPRRRVVQSSVRARLTNWLSPPSAKKLSSIPTRSSPSTSANSAHRFSAAVCAVPAAPRPPAAPAPAAREGRACRWASAEASSAPQTPEGTRCSGRSAAARRQAGPAAKAGSHARHRAHE